VLSATKEMDACIGLNRQLGSLPESEPVTGKVS
jgi:hypothetical protein